MLSRLVTFAGSAVNIEYEGALAARLIDFLYSDIPGDGQAAPHVTFRLLSDDVPGQFRFYRNDEVRYEGDSAATVAELLLGDTCFNLADRSQGGLLFHAAALAWQGRGILLPGTMGAGKTTLTAWLLSRGLDYLTDELVFIPQGALTVQALARPLNLKRPARPVLKEQLNFDIESHAARILSAAYTELSPPTLFNPTNTFSEPPLGLVIFPRYQAGREFELRPLSKAQAGLELMQCLINARNLPDHGFAEIIRLIRIAPAYTLRYANFAQIEPHLDALITSSK
jgi:hypothetical protein